MTHDSGICRAAHLAGITVTTPFHVGIGGEYCAYSSCTLKGETTTNYGTCWDISIYIEASKSFVYIAFV